MTNKPLHWDSLDEYFTKNPDYIKKIRKLVVDRLGFEPNLIASKLPEIHLRSSLKRFEEGNLSQEQFQTHVTDHMNIIKKNILRHVPNQTHLVEKEEIENTSR